MQGAFIEHEQVLGSLGIECIELRKAEDLDQNYDGLILPGGESTVRGKLLTISSKNSPILLGGWDELQRRTFVLETR